MKKISINFKIHQPYRLSRYRFFDIGSNHHYADDALNNSIIKQITQSCYDKLFSTMLDLVDNHSDKIKFGVSISGVAMSQIRDTSPQTYYTMRALSQSGAIEFLSQTYSASLASLYSTREFARQADRHAAYIKECFGAKTSKCFCNTSMIFSNEIAADLHSMGYHGAMIESRPDIMKWRNPNFVYASLAEPDVKLAIRNEQLSNSFIFQPNGVPPIQQAEEFIENLNLHHGDVNIIYLDVLNFAGGEMSDDAILYLSAIFKHLAASDQYEFTTLDDMIMPAQARDFFDVPFEISCGDIDKDVSVWLNNDLQREALDKLYALAERLERTNDEDLYRAWEMLQSSDHILYMSTKNDNARGVYSPYSSIYEAFINFMNVLSDLSLSVDKALALEDREAS